MQFEMWLNLQNRNCETAFRRSSFKARRARAPGRLSILSAVSKLCHAVIPEIVLKGPFKRVRAVWAMSLLSPPYSGTLPDVTTCHSEAAPLCSGAEMSLMLDGQ